MKRFSQMAIAAVFATAIVTPAFAGAVGMSRPQATVQPDPATIAELEDAAHQALLDGVNGNKNNLAFRQKNYEIEQLVGKMKNGQPVQQAQVEEALRPVHVW
jgi:hypothetical protein